MLVPSLDALMRVLIVTPLAYLAAVALLWISGKRSLATLNAFDLIVTGVTGFALLLLLQIVVSWLTSRRRVDTSVVRSEPTLVVRDGRFLPDALTEVRLTEDEVRQAVRSQGVGGLDQVAAVCLESDGSISVVTRSSVGDGSALADVRGWAGH